MLLTKFPLGVQHVHHFSLTRGFGNWLGYSARSEEKRYHCTFPRGVPGSWVGSASRTSGRWRGSRSITISSAIPDILPKEICLNQASVNKVFFKLNKCVCIDELRNTSFTLRPHFQKGPYVKDISKIFEIPPFVCIHAAYQYTRDRK